jgi:transcriptional regulator with XRE-family HTH domain
VTGAELKTWREAVGWTQAQLAKRLRVRVMTVSEWERAQQVPEKRVPQIVKLQGGV